MRAYLIDEISRTDIKKVNDFLNQNAIKSSLENIFWVKIPEDILSEVQYQHQECQPYVFAVELGADRVKLEFLIRNMNRMRCSCVDYCTVQQRDFIFNFAHGVIRLLGIQT